MSYNPMVTLDTCERTLTMDVFNAPDTAVSRVDTAYVMRPHTAHLTYRWDGQAFELKCVTLSGPLINPNGSVWKSCWSFSWDAHGNLPHGAVMWAPGVPAWVRALGEQYRDPDNPTD